MSAGRLGFWFFGWMLVVGGFAWATPGQEDQTGDVANAHKELRGDVYLPPADLLPEAPPVVPQTTVIRDGFVSVQVNVDAGGNNKRNDAANEPSIAVDPNNPDRVVIGWRQFDNIASNFRQSGVAYSQDGGKTWINNGPLSPGRFGSDPVLAADRNGVFYYMVLDETEMRLHKSSNGGVTWSSSILVITGFRDKQWFAVDRTGGAGNGLLYMTWTNTNNFTRSTTGGVSWDTPTRCPLDTTPWGTLSVAPNGDLLAVDRNFRVVGSTNAQNAGQTVVWDRNVQANLGGVIAFQDPPNPGGLLGQPWIVTDHSNGPSRGYVYVLAAVDPTGSDPLDVRFIRSTDGGRTWSASIRVNDDSTTNGAYQWFGAISVAPSGRLDATWYDTRATGSATSSEVWYAWSTDEGRTWSKNVPTTPAFSSVIGWPNQNKIGDYTGMYSDAIGAALAYSATFNGEQDVYYLRADVDCNGNKIHDGDDIKSGTSKDVNGNRIPDECENTCGQITGFTAKCKNGKLKATIKSNLPGGTVLHVSNNGGDQRTVTLNSKGKGTAKWTGQTGSHTVILVECPGNTQTVSCN